MTSQTMDNATSHALTSLGWVEWAQAIEFLTPLASLWLGPGGVTERAANDPLPEAMPVTTRIHAWSMSTDLLWRLIPRAADGTVLVTRLDTNDTSARADTSAVPVAITRSSTPDWERVWTAGPAPIMFIRRK